jgi:hypothetical protein|nr:MAG TPA: hypothetical protein [Caudoviricetes sp.]
MNLIEGFLPLFILPIQGVKNMEFEVFINALNEIIDKAKERDVEIDEVDILADNYYNCIQFSSKGIIVADLDLTESGPYNFYGVLRD